MGQNSTKQPVKREDLYAFHFLSDPVLSPDGVWAAYTEAQADEESNGYKNRVWVRNLKTGENRLLAARGGAKNPVWLDGESLLFASERDQEKEEAKTSSRYYRISVNGGEAQLFFALPVKADKVAVMADGRYLVSAATDDFDGNQADADGTYRAQRGKDYEIYEELPFWFNGKGIRSRKRQALYVYDAAGQTLTRISAPLQEVSSFAVSPDGRLAAYSGPVYDSLRPRTSALYVYDAAAGSSRQLTEAELYETDNVCFFGSGRIFYTGTTYERVGKHPRYYLYDLTAGETRQLPYCDAAIGSSVGSDAKFGSGRSLVYCGKKDLLYMTQTSWGDSRILAMAADGTLREVSRQPGAVTGFDVRGDVLVMTAMRGDHLAELYALSPEDGAETKLTDFNDGYLETHAVVTPEAFRYESRNGYTMEGYVIRPAQYEPGKKYPAVLEIHGGPKGVLGSVFFHEMQCLASDGFFVIYTNPRGSDGRGEAFADITEVFGKDDFDDLMEFTDQALSHCPDIDPERVGICGGSYGGFMCNWMVGHTHRYAAAVSQRSISNYLTKCLYTDIGYYANRLQMGAYPWEDFHKVWSMSPLSGAAQARTPLLLLQSDEDYRCWMGDAVQMFSAVKRQGVPTRMVLFHGENHELSRGGRPKNRIRRLQELEQWLKTYC